MRSVWPIILVLASMTTWTSGTVSESFLATHEQRLGQTLARLDSSLPALVPVVQAWNNGNKLSAAQGLADYFRHKEFETSLLEQIEFPPDYMEQANAAANDTFRIHGNWITVPRNGLGRLDWEYTAGSGDKEIAWMLNRHAVLPLLAKACTESPGSGCREVLNQILANWIEDCPYPDRTTFSAQWRPLEAARRVLNSWIHVFYGPGSLLDDDTILLVLTSVPEHADALLEHASFWGGNHLMTEKIALLAIACAWPEFRQSGHWKTHAIAKVTRLLQDQFYPDGSYKELSNHYQYVVLSNLVPFLRLVRHDNQEFENAALYESILGMWEFFTWSMKPDGSGPVNNASDKEMNSNFIKSTWAYFDRPDWLGIASNGREGILPGIAPSRIFPWAGQVFMRNNWGKSADWVYFDAGPYGTAHQHVDRMHLSVTLAGRDLLSDSGRFTYKPGRLRDYFKGPRSHSVVLLDGHPARQGPRKLKSPMEVAFQDHGEAVYASANSVFEMPGEPLRAPVPWTRDVIYDKRGFVVVLDHVDAVKRYEMEVLWQFSPGVTLEEAASSVQASPSPRFKATVRVSGRETDPIAGFFSPDYNHKIPTVQAANQYSIKSPTTIAHVISSPGTGLMTVQAKTDRESGTTEFILFKDGSKVSEGVISSMGERQLKRYSIFPVR